MTVNGAAFALDVPPSPEAVWGDGGEVLWSRGEPLIVSGPPGVGKSTLTGQLLLRRAGVRTGDLLGFPVEVCAGRTLLIAADRPRQQARSLRRMVREEDRHALGASIEVQPGPLPFDLTDPQGPEHLAEYVAGVPEVATVVLDSLGALALGLSDDLRGGQVARGMQALVATGIEVLAVHHSRKQQAENGRPRKLDDLYGSRWLSAAAGSVVGLWGEAGDPIVELLHLKQPAEPVGPLRLLHDHERGATSLFEPVDLLTELRTAGMLSASDAARKLFGSSTPSDAERQKARRKLDKLVSLGVAERRDGSSRAATVYVPLGARS